MKRILAAIACMLAFALPALEYEVQFENEQVNVARVKVMPQIVIALQGGTITRLEQNGTKTEVQFPTGKAVFREVDPPEQLHCSVNDSSEAVELIIVQLKSAV